jgi:hypothetical protein
MTRENQEILDALNVLTAEVQKTRFACLGATTVLLAVIVGTVCYLRNSPEFLLFAAVGAVVFIVAGAVANGLFVTFKRIARFEPRR